MEKLLDAINDYIDKNYIIDMMWEEMTPEEIAYEINATIREIAERF